MPVRITVVPVGSSYLTSTQWLPHLLIVTLVRFTRAWVAWCQGSASFVFRILGTCSADPVCRLHDYLCQLATCQSAVYGPA